jgi:hypothetical protein
MSNKHCNFQNGHVILGIDAAIICKKGTKKYNICVHAGV